MASHAPAQPTHRAANPAQPAATLPAATLRAATLRAATLRAATLPRSPAPRRGRNAATPRSAP